jgi:hypothetical protein
MVMRRVLLVLAACALGLSLMAGTASADHYWRHPPGYYHGVAFRGGYYYPGRDHYHWAWRVWDGHYGRYHYYDSYYHCYYYWHPRYNCYYPISYCP